MINPISFMENLARTRPVFCSEADFQHTFAWELHNSLPGIKVRLELPWDEGEKQNHLDIWAEGGGCVLAVELKYKTRGLDVCVDNEEYHLRDQSAQDHGRYDFIKDVTRLEQMAARYKNFVGLAILLTNDSAYWKMADNQLTVDARFRLHERQMLFGELAWGKGASSGTMKNREQPLTLVRNYTVNWHDYSNLSRETYGRFRYTVLVIG